MIADCKVDKMDEKQDIKPMQQELLDKHFLRKHGANAYYGQKKK